MLPLVEEDRGPGKLLGDDPEVPLDQGHQALPGPGLREALQHLLEAGRRLAHHLQEELFLGGDGGVEASPLEVLGLGQVADAGGVVPPLAEEMPGHLEDLAAAVHG